MIPGIVAGAPVDTGSSDPYWASVLSLLHFDGTNGSTTFTDEKGHIWSASGGGQLTNTEAMFGGTSLRCSASTSDSIDLDDDAGVDWGFPGDFTIEAWVWQSSSGAAADQCVLGVADAGVSGGLLLGVYFGAPYVAHTAVSSVLAPSPMSSNTWHHIAATRQGTTTRLFVDGTLVNSGTDASAYPDSSVRIGSVFNPSDGGVVAYFNGYVDELRVTKGVARYTANFTPPVAPFPNH